MTYVIAEIGSNWFVEENNDHKNIKSVIASVQKAREAGADAAKFQLLSSKELYGYHVKDSPIDKYTLKDAIIEAAAVSCKINNIDFMCSAFSTEGYKSIDQYVKMHKVASCEAVDLKLIDSVFAFDKRVMVSTGGLTESQINVLLSRYPEGQLVLADCVIDYPAEPDQYNLCVLAEWLEHGLTEVAFSDHTMGYATALAAQGLGATIFEKHVNFGTSIHNSPDSDSSITMEVFKDYCQVLKTHRIRKQLSSFERANVTKHQRRELEHGFYRPH